MKKILYLLLPFLLVSYQLSAQVINASMRGVVIGEDAGKLVGATVLLSQSETGVLYATVTDANGRFAIYGIKPNSGYKLLVEFLGYKPFVINGLSLRIGEEIQRNITLVPDAASLEEIVVSATPSRLSGVTQHYTDEDINLMPTVSRSLYDLVRLSPHAMVNKGGGMTYGGVANRFNAFMVDGMANNDMYGLSSSGTNGGLSNANPVALDAIAQLEVAVAPYDVRISGFNGGAINAITKSGTNQFSGTAYTYFNNQDFYGDGPSRSPLSEQSTQIYGVTLGGALVKNKLFFFLSGEYRLETSPSSFYLGYEGSNLLQDELDRISEKYKALTGFNGGGYGERDVDQWSASLMAKLDWNINSHNTLSLSYSFLDARSEGYANALTSFAFNKSGYANYSTAHYLAAIWESRLSSSLHNSLRLGYSRVTDGRDPDYAGGLPSVIVRNTGYTGNVTVNIGTNRNAGINDLKQNVFILTDDLILDVGSHSVIFGMHHELYDIHNRYIANAYGTYTYNSITDFEQDKAAIYEYNYTDPSVAGSTTWGPKFRAAELNFYIQDAWDLGRGFSLKYGLRATLPLIFNSPTPNKEFNASALAQRHGVRIGDIPKSQLLLSPRVALAWSQRYDSGELRVNLGAGIFTGQVPFVWIVNNYSNTGVEQKGVKLVAEPGQSAMPFTLIPSPTTLSNTSFMLNAMDADFRYPQNFKTNLSVEYLFDNGWEFAFDALYTKTIYGARFSNIAIEPRGEVLHLISGCADKSKSLPLFKHATSDYSAIYYMQNTSKGYSYSIASQVSKRFDFGLTLAASYVFGHSYSVSDVPSTSSSTNWTRGYAIDLNNTDLSFSAYDIPHKLSLTASYYRRYTSLFDITVGLVYQMTSGQRYSLCFGEGGDVNGDGVYGSTLMYIPTEAEMQQMRFADDDSMLLWNDFIDGDSYLRSHRGMFAERNAMQTPMEHRLDLHLAHGFYFGADSHRKIELSLDIMNFGNLICRDWGTFYNVSGWRLQPVKIESVEDGEPIYKFTSAKLTPDNLLSRWHMQIGARIIF